MENHEKNVAEISIIFVKNHKGNKKVKLNEAIIKRINDICTKKGISVCEASLSGGKSPSSIYDLLKGRTKCSKVSTIQSFCEGAGVSLAEFFAAEYFNDLDD